LTTVCALFRLPPRNLRSNFDIARLCLLEQHLPEGADHPFAKTMLEHFQKQTPLRCLTSYSTMASQKSRFKSASWQSISITDLWSLWQDPKFAPEERIASESVEPFDEWEELALFAGHYFLLVATTSASIATNISEHTLNYEIPYSISPSVEIRSHDNPRGQGLRRFGAVLNIDNDTVAFHGGLLSTARQTNCDIYTRATHNVSFKEPPENIMCHTITNFDSDFALLVGGRNSPAKASSHCWIMKNNEWSRTHDLLPARYRHCSAAVKVDDVWGVLTFGGKTSDGCTLDEWSFFDSGSGWQQVKVSTENLPPLFGAAMATTGDASGIIVGGMSQIGILHAHYTTWELSKGKDGLSIRFESRMPRLNEVGIASPATLRFGASLVQSKWGLLLIGGIGPRGALSSSEEILVLRKYGRMDKFEQLFNQNMPRPLLVGCGAINVNDGSILIIGGSAVCFSFGAFWNEKSYLLCPKEETSSLNTWRLTIADSSNVQSNGGSLSEQDGRKLPGGEPENRKETQALRHAQKLPLTRLSTTEEFQDILTHANPIVIGGLNLGTCTELWTSEYLKEKIGPDRSVVIHAASTQHLSFHAKNFTYETQPFSTFIDAASAGSHVYLRAISSSQPNKSPASLRKDFPEIAEDFAVPSQCQYAVEHEHSSVLRISGKTTMWLHYDIMANILCQVRGSKRVILFPPSDVSLLQFPAGETTSNLHVFTAEEGSLESTRPVETILKEGEVLFIPACWPHATAPADDGVSVAVNVFFRGLEGGYAAGRDVYGNRDLDVYVNGRRDVGRVIKIFKRNVDEDAWREVQRLSLILRDAKGFEVGERGKGVKELERIIKSMDGLPDGIKDFYLRRLADELVDAFGGSIP
jgi:tRNA wybutosine-synthesizing protein 4